MKVILEEKECDISGQIPSSNPQRYSIIGVYFLDISATAVYFYT